MKTYLASDHHFNHEFIVSSGSRPFETVKEMNYHIIKQHNSVVKPEDTVYFLGDFCWTDDLKEIKSIVKMLNGSKHLILGNHDKQHPFDYMECGFFSVHTSLVVDDFLLIHDPAIGGVLRDLKVIHGHLHGMGRRLGPNTWNVCMEMIDNYTPIDFDVIKENW